MDMSLLDYAWPCFIQHNLSENIFMRLYSNIACSFISILTISINTNPFSPSSSNGRPIASVLDGREEFCVTQELSELDNLRSRVSDQPQGLINLTAL